MDSVFFVISKLVWALLSPSNLFIFLTLVGVILLARNRIVWAKRVLLPTALLSGVIMAYPFGDALMQPLENRFSQPSELPKQMDGIIILGGGEDLSVALSRPENALGNELGEGGDRYLGAAYLAQAYPDLPVIFTGGSGSVQLQTGLKEGQFAQQTLAVLGIGADRLIVESQSRNTYENFMYVKPLLPKPDGHYLLVTSAFHMARSVGIARKLGVKVVPFPVDYRAKTSEYRNMDFDYFDHLKSLEPACREWLGLTVYYLTGKTSAWFPAP